MLREVVLPGLRAQPGLRHAYAGRSGASDTGPRLVASVWELDVAPGEPPAELVSLLGFERSDAARDVALEVLPVALALPFEQPDEPRILRVFRGQTRAGELDAYVEEVREGTYADVMAQHGPLALFLGIKRPDSFVTVSVWSAWEHIQAATGGNLLAPIATQHSERLIAGDATHYEIVPNSLGTAGHPTVSG
ncbi:MAG TPA: hypothetical protein VMP67_08805 [Candidatus Limnocylindria bacterium]|nr:hypothetical protein [Candidatus Limnocylindria bacterium]